LGCLRVFDSVLLIFTAEANYPDLLLKKWAAAFEREEQRQIGTC
jgi:hypothetical protein